MFIAVTKSDSSCNCFSIRNRIYISEIDVYNLYQISKYWKQCGQFVSAHLNFVRMACTPLLFRIPMRGGKIICKRGRQRNRLCKTNRDTFLPSSSVRFFCVSFSSPAGQSASFVRVPIRISVRMYKERKNRELVRGSMRNGRPSLPLARLSWQSRRVTMNGWYYFIGDQAKSKIEKRTGPRWKKVGRALGVIDIVLFLLYFSLSRVLPSANLSLPFQTTNASNS